MTPENELPRSGCVQYATWEEQRAITNSSRKNEAACWEGTILFQMILHSGDPHREGTQPW